MTKKEFLSTDEPLVMIVSLDPASGKVLYDTYKPEHADGWMADIKKDFPKMMHFRTSNPAALKQRNTAMFGKEFADGVDYSGGN